jgi:disulfide bond formation protein DsbB
MSPSLATRTALFLIAVGILSLGAALGSQYVWADLQPCVLCIYQRYPYVVVIALGVLMLLVSRKVKLAALLAALGAVALFVDAGIAGFHVGVEQHWWAGTAACTSQFDPNLTLEELQKLIEAAPVVPCDVPAWEMFGISMAGYNFLYAMATGVIAAILSSRLFRSAR